MRIVGIVCRLVRMTMHFIIIEVVNVPVRIPWNQHEVALLINAYLRIAKGADLGQTAEWLSRTLRRLAIQSGQQVDDTFRNVNGMKMQLANVQYLFTDGQRGLSGASTMMRQMYGLYQSNPAEYQTVLKEAIRLTGSSVSIEDAFFSYAKEHMGLSNDMLADYLQKATDYCHLKQPLLGMKDVKAVRNVQQKIAEGKLLRFRYGKDAQAIRNVTQLYYTFIKNYREPKEELSVQTEALADEKTVSTQESAPAVIADFSVDPQSVAISDVSQKSYNEQGDIKVKPFTEKPGEDWLVHKLRTLKISYVDNRSVNGCLWIASDMSIPISFNEAAERGYRLLLKPDGCRAYPNRPVLWTKDRPQKTINTADFRRKLDERFTPFLLSVKKLAASTAAQYSQSVEVVERFMLEHGMDCTLDTTEPDEAQRIYDILIERQDFVDWDNMQHHQYSAALAQYISYLRKEEPATEDPDPGKALTIKDAAVIVLQEAGQPLTISEMLQRIKEKNLYKFGSSGATNLYISIRRYCKGMESRHHAPVDVFERFTDEAGQIRYKLIGENTKLGGSSENRETLPIDERWLPILQDSFPDGYILRDFLGQFQATAFWQERYGEECPIQGDAIDVAMKAVGVVRDGRVFVKSEEDKQLIANICREINDILSRYTTVYRSCIYESYQEQLASISIYTEPVMTQQLLNEAKGSFYSVNQVFAKPGQFASVIQDAQKVLREHGGPMPVDEVAKVLWFIPRDMVYHYLSVDDESLNIGNSTWMLAEHFPVTKEDAAKIGNMLDEYFLSNSYVQAFDLMPLLRDRLPGIADNLSGMTYQAVFNIVAYYLRDRFNFTKAIISPKGTSIDFTDLFRAFAAERDTFTLTDLEALASELKLPIYWESTYAGGAVRVSKTEFVNKRLIQFDVDAIDAALADFCPGDYLPLMSVSSAMMMHLPSCGYRWNGYLLQSYVFGFSKVFRLSYSSFGKTGYYGAMVRRSCKTINNYGSLIERVLTDDDTWETTADALDVLVNCGYQAMRKYKGIDNVVAQARRNKLPDDGR